MIVKTNKVVVETPPTAPLSPVVTWVHLPRHPTEECWHGRDQCCDAYQVLMSNITEAACPRQSSSLNIASVVSGWDLDYNYLLVNFRKLQTCQVFMLGRMSPCQVSVCSSAQQCSMVSTNIVNGAPLVTAHTREREVTVKSCRQILHNQSL